MANSTFEEQLAKNGKLIYTNKGDSIIFLEVSVPWVKKSKLLIPAAYVYRFLRGLTNSK